MSSLNAHDMEQRRAVLEELQMLCSSLVDGELEWSLRSAEEQAAWETALQPDAELSDSDVAALPLPDFAVLLAADVHLTVQYHKFATDIPELAIHAATIERADQAALAEELRKQIAEVAQEDTPYPVFTIFTALREHLSAHPLSASNPAPRPAPPPASTTCPTELQLKVVLIWSHHLLATGKRKNIVAWATELHLWGISKPGYPGVIVIEGVEPSVDEFVWRIKQLNWKALQIRCEVPGLLVKVPHSAPNSTSPLSEADAIQWALREKTHLGKILGKEGEKVGVTEVAELGMVGDLMTRAGLEDVFRTAMKL